MSVLYPFKPYSEVNDFYDNIQNIKDYESNDSFGKPIASYPTLKNVKKTCSYKDLTAMYPYDDAVRKSFSTNSFQEADYDVPVFFGNSPFTYGLEDHSTKGSLSSTTSMSSALAGSTNNISATTAATAALGKKKGKKGGKKKNPGEISYKQKYKTEVCKYWNEKGYCEFGDQCAFAHGGQEIRQKSHISSNYKTKKCIQFHESGYCPYGSRCQFIHSLKKDSVSNTALKNTTYDTAIENAEIWFTHDPDCVCTQKKTRRRLPSFQLVSGGSESNDESGEIDSMNKSCESWRKASE